MSGTKRKPICAFGGLLALAVITAPLSSPYAYAAMAAGQAQLAKLMDGYRRPADIPAPPDNPITPAKVALGKALFFDPRLSGSGVISCASCHNPSLGWQDGLAKGVGDHGSQLARRTPTILNLAWSAPLFWDGRAATLEEQAKVPMAAGDEMNKPHDQVVAQVKAIPGYRAAFATAYPGEDVNIDTIAKAIATYERTVISGRSPFDEWLGGEEAAISASAKQGFVLFNTTAKCASCHSGWRFTDDGFHDIGLAGDDPGRGRIMPKIAVLDHAFKTPTLRNVADRSPYMHDGSMRTLEEVVDHYDHGFIKRPSLADQIKPLGLSAQDKADLLAFMRTLSSHDDTVVAPTLPH
ncbi:c-type cytochrome [Phenylobacterium sp. LjRoot225]|uniref:cytochrome-c peroxidase n=1 Tax=Phenylobacterium sp. LjRoot225 TaxID=3342285 RepID=UPI003ECCED57